MAVIRKSDFAVDVGPEVEMKTNGTKMPANGAFVECGDKKGNKFKVRESVRVKRIGSMQR